ncbi:MAG: N-acetyltransferase [Sphingobacteriia bacterium]|nr:N-acetyltransferase [Sphingobacteriia bacterium]
MTTYLSNDKITLRALEPEDLEIMFRWENDSEFWKYGSTLEPYSKYLIKQYIAYSDKTIYEKKQLRLIIELKNKSVVGCIDLFDFDAHHSRAGIGLLIDRNFQHQGFADMALKLLCHYAFSFLQLHQLYAHIPATNAYCLQLFRHNNFSECGIFKEWLHNENAFTDVHVFQKIAAK